MGGLLFFLIMISMFLSFGEIPFIGITPFGWVIGIFILIVMILGAGS